MRNYHPTGFWFYFRLISALIGVLVGASASASFAMVFDNIHCSIWAFTSSALALIVLILHIAVRRDVAYSISPKKFLLCMLVGIIFAVIGFGVIVGYLIKGIIDKESGVQVKGKFIVTVWGFMTWKWGFSMYYFANNYHKALLAASTEILSTNSIDG
ncbi:heme transporter hrg1-A-like [Hydra vulgaris]|uniref:Heme transporter hrg1-A-like n=1 Tax=Hydra vulgaris TaxID=6087 RepID=A0ABM4BU67_HYDVU